jgi:hypothetical protein
MDKFQYVKQLLLNQRSIDFEQDQEQEQSIDNQSLLQSSIQEENAFGYHLKFRQHLLKI